MKVLPAIVLTCSLLLAGCVAPAGSAGKVTFWNPATWFSGSAGRDAGRADAKQEQAERAVIKAAQKTAHETAVALASAPQSRPVEVARESAGVTVGLLDQAAGPLTAEETARVRDQIGKLLSETASLRAEGERLRAENRETVATLSDKLAKAEAGKEAATRDLQAAFVRENELANSLRNQRFILWAVAILAVLGYAGLWYLRIVYGGMPNAIGRGLAELRAKNPGAAEAATMIFDQHLNRNEQQRIARHS